MSTTGTLEWCRGEACQITFTITARDITGWAITFEIKTDHSASSALASRTVGSGITLSSPTTGIGVITITRANTVDLAPGQYVYVLKRTDLGSETMLADGSLTLRAPK